MPPCAATVCDRVGNSLVMHLRMTKDTDHVINGFARPKSSAPPSPASKDGSTRMCNVKHRSAQLSTPKPHAVLKPSSDRPTDARRPAPPAPTTMASYV